ncbi:efflux RND transporter periplasmic adaptor subunit [Oricola sp.]|uniref:efflux RND transporter periplasmic adaptor subunit n=1 Tax=Oricola sp. TaxID=1979950 RepID=UPI0025FCE2DE|nr:efflux RND transporter periplasmic adaptor subunit [Oricola sp.]MCI5077852.1 efflux RND transporter periplasmic adaptor subunit [Oricola sp.]
MKPVRTALFACLLAAASPVTSALAQMPPQGERPPTPVTVVTVKQEDVTITSKLPGRIVASGVAEVRPQVNGIIVERLFQEGSRVEEGDVLYRIDPATYEAQVAAARAAVAQAQVNLDSGERELKRLQALQAKSVASEQTVDNALTARDAAAAALQVAKAQELAAGIDLERTTIRAQLSGTIGRTLTTQGALVTAGQASALAVIRKLDPVYVDVMQSAAEIIAWRREGGADAGRASQSDVALTLADRTRYEHLGQFTATEPNVDEQTGVVTVRMQFPNPDELLLPGMYVQVEVPQAVVAGAVLAPQEGVTRDRNGGATAMVVNAEGVVEVRPLTVIGDRDAYWIVSQGLQDGDRMIVAGFQKIAPGAKVAPQERQ